LAWNKWNDIKNDELGLIFFGQRECIVQNWLGIFGEVDWAEDWT